MIKVNAVRRYLLPAQENRRASIAGLIPKTQVRARFFAEFTLNAVKGLNDKCALVILNGA